MIRNLLATTAIATLVASGAVAQTTSTGETTAPAAQDQQQQEMTVRAEGHLASNLIGESVHNGTGEQAEDIGDVTDLVISQDGNIEAIVVGVGGFLGIGQKEVALEYDLVQWSQQQDGERWLIVETTADALQAQQEFDRTAYRPMPADAEVAETRPATQEDLAAAPQQDQQGTEGTTDETAVAPQPDQDTGGQDTAAMPEDEQQTEDDTVVVTETETQQTTGEGQDVAVDQNVDDQQQVQSDQQETAETEPLPEDTEQEMAADQSTGVQEPADADREQTAQTEQDLTGGQAGTDQVQTGAVDRNTLQQAQPDQLRAENLTGTTVYGANEENVGEIGDVILTPEGDVDAVIVNVGGFLGIGEKEVAIGMDNLAFMTDENGDLYLYTQLTQEQLEAQPEYDESTYAQQRDEMRMQVQ